MLSFGSLVWGIAAAVVVITVLLLLFLPLSPEARLRRRRRKTHSRVVSRSDRPSVKFSVKPPKEK